MKYIFHLFVFLFIFSSCNNNSLQRNYLTKTEIKKDCKVLNKYLRNAYISYDENLLENDGLTGIEENILSDLKLIKTSKISVQDFQNSIVKELQKDITIPDAHLTVFSDYGYNNIFLHQSIYFTDIILYERNGIYYISQNYDENIKQDDVYTGSNNNIFKIIQTDGTTSFQYGVKSSKKINRCIISINNQNYMIKVFSERELLSDFYVYNPTEKNISVKNNTIYISNLDFYNPQKYLSDFSILSDEIKNFNVVIDLRNNSGGNTQTCLNYLNFILFAQNQLENLNQFEKFESKKKKVLVSSPIWDANYELSKKLGINKGKLAIMNVIKFIYKVFHIKYIYSPKDQELDYPEFSTTYYPKKIIILMNRNTSSAAELLIADLYELAGSRVITIGENSAGCVNFMGNFKYILPNSKIGICLSNIDDRGLKQFNNPKFFGELKGFYPDYWITDTNLNEYINYIIKE